MKKIFTTLLSFFSFVILFGQDVRLSDSVIFINNEPVAFYARSFNETPLHYNIEVYNNNDDVLIKAEVIKFDAPVEELKPFYYYELTFPPTGDTLAIYLEDEAFPLVLGKIISDYKLINKNKLNRKNVAYFRTSYYGGPALKTKIKSYEEYLDRTRYYYDQAKRDRTKPVIIINDRIIMQDGVKIGVIAEKPEEYNNNSNYTVGTLYPEFNFRNRDFDIFLPSQKKIDFYKAKSEYYKFQEIKSKNLYKISIAGKIASGTYTDFLLIRICYLIEEYAL